MIETATVIDWPAADQVATKLGAHTRSLVAARDVDAVRSWAQRMAYECSADGVSEGNWPRAASYLELATLVQHDNSFRDRRADLDLDAPRRET